MGRRIAKLFCANDDVHLRLTMGQASVEGEPLTLGHLIANAVTNVPAWNHYNL